MFFRKNRDAKEVKTGRFELEQDGQTAYIEYSMTGKVVALLHTEVPEALRGHGIASELTRSALEYAREKGMKWTWCVRWQQSTYNGTLSMRISC